MVVPEILNLQFLAVVRRRGIQMKKKCKILVSKKGSSLIELVVSMLISSIMLLMVTASVGPVAKLTLRMQKTQLAQEIIENISVELRSQMADAIYYVKIYENGTDEGILDKTGAETGTVLEYQNTQGYIEVLSTDGCNDTDIIRGITTTGEVKAKDKGRLLDRYYFPVSGKYNFQNKDGKPIARAVSNVFTDRFYMDHYVKIIFSYPQSGGSYVADGTVLEYIHATIELYNDAEMKPEDLVTTEDVVLDFRYEIKRDDTATAEKQVLAGT